MGEAIIKGLQTGDRQVIKNIYKESFGYCSSFVLNNRGSMEQARDLFQEAIMVLLKNSRNPDFTLTCQVKTYLYSVMRNKWLKEINKQSRGGLQLVIDEETDREFVMVQEDTLEEKKEQEEQFKAVSKALEAIKEDCKKLIMSFYYKKIDLSHLAEQMGYTYQFIKVKKNRCMNALKAKVREIYQNE